MNFNLIQTLFFYIGGCCQLDYFFKLSVLCHFHITNILVYQSKNINHECIFIKIRNNHGKQYNKKSNIILITSINTQGITCHFIFFTMEAIVFKSKGFRSRMTCANSHLQFLLVMFPPKFKISFNLCFLNFKMVLIISTLHNYSNN